MYNIISCFPNDIQLASRQQQSQSDEQKWLHKMLNILKQLISFLNIPKDRLSAEIEGNIGRYEGFINTIIAKHGSDRSVASNHQGYTVSQQMNLPSQSRPQLQPGNLHPSKSVAQTNSGALLEHTPVMSSGTSASSHTNELKSQHSSSLPQINAGPVLLNPEMLGHMYLKQQQEQKMLKEQNMLWDMKSGILQQKQQEQKQLSHPYAGFTDYQTQHVPEMINAQQEFNGGNVRQDQFGLGGPHSGIQNQQVMTLTLV